MEILILWLISIRVIRFTQGAHPDGYLFILFFFFIFPLIYANLSRFLHQRRNKIYPLSEEREKKSSLAIPCHKTPMNIFILITSKWNKFWADCYLTQIKHLECWCYKLTLFINAWMGRKKILTEKKKELAKLYVMHSNKNREQTQDCLSNNMAHKWQNWKKVYSSHAITLKFIE